jgi:hypothetical protein
MNPTFSAAVWDFWVPVRSLIAKLLLIGFFLHLKTQADTYQFTVNASVEESLFGFRKGSASSPSANHTTDADPSHVDFYQNHLTINC